MPLGQNADEIVGVEINRIGIGRRDVASGPSQHPPGTIPEKVLAPRCAERRLETRIVRHAGGCEYLFGVGRPDNVEFALPVHRFLFVPFATVGIV